MVARLTLDASEKSTSSAKTEYNRTTRGCLAHLLSAICYSARLSRARWMSYDQVSWNDPIQLFRLMTFPWPTLWPGLLSALTCSAMVLPESPIFPDLPAVCRSCSRKPGCLARRSEEHTSELQSH